MSLLLLAIRDRRGQRLFEQLITGLLLLIAIGFTASFFVATPPPGAVLGGLVPASTAPKACCWPLRSWAPL
ncbi:natural resistance-associated macrophage family protein [Mycobacterium xenopi 3993]|nr:natural resistance-associated macrophage family protein [Mycobacterium xenopi 3993]